MKYTTRPQALLLLADGTLFYGKSIGISGTTFGEVCFNTGMTGYQEVFTDPSYFGQIMVTTNAHIGNYGVNASEVESDQVMISGLVCKILVSPIHVPIRKVICLPILKNKMSSLFPMLIPELW